MTLTLQIQQHLIGHGLTLATAESCTGGRIAAAFTANAGASAFFEGGVVAYQNRVKERLLGVEAATIAHCDVVSREVAEAMVRGAVAIMRTDLAIASTGYAGPTGGTPAIPCGTMWVACGTANRQLSLCLHGDQDRERNVGLATEAAIRLLAQFLKL